MKPISSNQTGQNSNGDGLTASATSTPETRSGGSPKKPGFGLLLFGLILTGIGLFALNEGFGLFDSSRTYMDEEAILHGSLIGSLGLLLFGRGLAKRTHSLVFPLPLLLVGATVFFSWSQRNELRAEEEAEHDQREEIFDDFVEVCEEGEGIDDAETFAPGRGDHPALAYFGRGPEENLEWSPDWNNTPEDWAVDDADDVELVACIQVSESSIGSCDYSTGTSSQYTVSRSRYLQTLVLREAKTGRELHREEFPGSDPSECPASYDLSKPSTIYGSLVSDDTIYKRIDEFMEDGEAIQTP